jgi:hypothetical protein
MMLDSWIGSRGPTFKRKFAGEEERLIYELPDNTTTNYQDDVR